MREWVMVLRYGDDVGERTGRNLLNGIHSFRCISGGDIYIFIIKIANHVRYLTWSGRGQLEDDINNPVDPFFSQ